MVCGGLWWFAVVCGGLWWFVVDCGGLSFSHTPIGLHINTVLLPGGGDYVRRVNKAMCPC